MNYETQVVDRADVTDALAGDVDGLDPSANSRLRRRKLFIVIGILVAAVVIVALMITLGGKDSAADGRRNTAPAISVIVPGQGTVAGLIKATGTLAARREMPVGVVGEGGRVVSVPVEPGDWVRAGQVLAVIDRSVQSQQLDSIAAQVRVAQADAKLAQANLDRALQLIERGFISQADLDRLTATRDAAEARVAVAQAEYRERQALNARLNIVAPEAGLLLERHVEPGQVVTPGSGVLFSIARGGEMELLAQLGENDLAAITPGVAAAVIPVGTGKSFAGQVWQVSPVIDENNRQGIARIALDYAPELRPGGFASAQINSGTVVAPLLPESAILNDDSGSYVFIAAKDDKVERRAVELGMVTADGIIISSGLDGSERVVLRAGGFLSVGETIRPVAVKQ